MPSPSERLAAIISAYRPSEVIFKPGKSKAGAFVLESYVTKPLDVDVIDSDLKLQAAFDEEISELWNNEGGNYYINATVDGLWSTIKRSILKEYEDVSKRCAATKRKTEQFIRDIKIDDKYLPNFLIQTFIMIRSNEYQSRSYEMREAHFEQFESLRRSYGKRN